MEGPSDRTRRRLDLEAIGWLTTVDDRSRPRTSPVWFLWDGDTITVYSLAGTARTRNLAVHAEVSLHLDGDGLGGDVVIVEGTAAVDPTLPPADRNPAYLDKYGRFMAANGWTPEWFAERYPIGIRIEPRTIRSW